MEQTSRTRLFLPPRWFIRIAWMAHRFMYRVTGGRRSLRRPRATTYGLMRLDTTGARTGKRRTAILGYWEDGANLYTLAMNGWGDPDPKWWLNLQAHPEAMVEIEGVLRPVIGRAAFGDERARLWAAMRQREPNLDRWAALRTRETAVVVFEPRPPR